MVLTKSNIKGVLKINIIKISILLLVVAHASSFAIPAYARTRGSALSPAALARGTNEERQLGDRAVLLVNPLLTLAAQMKADDMAAKGYFAHTSPEGKTPWYWIEQAGYHYQYAGENLAVDFRNPEDVTAAWMASPSHRVNIMDRHYVEIGTGIATGVWNGRKATFIVQVYANPAPIIASIRSASLYR